MSPKDWPERRLNSLKDESAYPAPAKFVKNPEPIPLGSQNFVSSFSLELPFKERFKILKTIPFEVEDHTPFQSSKVLFDVKVCQISEKNKTRILSFVTPEESVQDFLQILQGLDRPIHLLSCSVASLANLLETWNTPLSKAQNPDPSPGAYLYLGIENSYLFFYKRGFLQNVSVVDWGCGGMIDEMQSVYKLSRDKAWQEFFNKAFLLTQAKGFTKEQVFFSNLVKKHAEEFIPKLNLLKMSLEAKKDLKVSRVMLFGPGAAIKNLSSFLSDSLSLSVYKSRHLTAFPNWDWREKPSALIAVGLTLEGLKRSPYPGLDFLSFQKQSPSFISLGKMKNRALFGLLALFILFSYAFVKKYETDQILEELRGVFKEYSQKIAYLAPDKIEVKEVESFLREQSKKREAEGQIQKELLKPSPMDSLEKIVMKIGSAENWDLSLEHLKISGWNVEMRGSLKASQLKSFQSLMQSLASTRLEAAGGDAELEGAFKKTGSPESSKKTGKEENTDKQSALEGGSKDSEEAKTVEALGDAEDSRKAEALGDIKAGGDFEKEIKPADEAALGQTKAGESNRASFSFFFKLKEF